MRDCYTYFELLCVLCVDVLDGCLYGEKLLLIVVVGGGGGGGGDIGIHRVPAIHLSQQVEPPARIFSTHTAQSHCFCLFPSGASCFVSRGSGSGLCACASSVCAIIISGVFHLCEHNRFAAQKISCFIGVSPRVCSCRKMRSFPPR